MGRTFDIALGILNGTLGDHLARTGNALATEMAFVVSGAPIPATRAAFAAALREPSRDVVVFVHGVMSTESVWAFPDGATYGASLERDAGMTALFVRYNSGRAIADSGAVLDALLETLVAVYPVPIASVLLVGHSMGGLVIRSACHAARTPRTPRDVASAWLPLTRRAIYVGTPHDGAPLERLGRVVSKVLRTVPDPITRLLAEVSDLRSAGIQDLGDADVRHEDRARRMGGLSLRDPRHPVPLLPEIRHFLIAGSIASAPWLSALFGDALVPIASASAVRSVALDAPLPPSHVKLLAGVGHMALAHHPDVYAQMRAWIKSPEETG